MNKNNLADKKNHIIKLINESLRELEIEISKSSNGLDAIDESEHLQSIKHSLTTIKINLDQNKTEIIAMYKPNISRIVIDTWPMDNQLGNQICEIEYLYGKIKSAHQNKK
jgi:hypothetical protein